MFHLIIITFAMSATLDMLPVKVEIKKEMYTKSECATLASENSKVMPLEPGDDARWQTALCAQLLSISEPTPSTEWRYP